MTDTHQVPPTDSDARQHELTPDCWCSPTSVTVWEGTEFEAVRYQHYQESIKLNRSQRRAVARQLRSG